jgi:hypothetical protein
MLYASELMKKIKMNDDENALDLHLQRQKLVLLNPPPCFRPRPAVLSFSPQLGRHSMMKRKGKTPALGPGRPLRTRLCRNFEVLNFRV